MGRGRCLWDGVGPYGVLTVPMGWGHSLRDAVGPYGALTVPMGWGHSWDGDAPYGMGALIVG